MKLLVCVVALSFLAILGAVAETQRWRDGTYTYDPHDWHWNPQDFDTPPNVVGGYGALVRRLSYPESLRRRRIQGHGAALIAVDSTGKVRSISFLSPRMRPELEQIVISAVTHSQFTPALRKGKRIAAYLRFPVTFVAP